MHIKDAMAARTPKETERIMQTAEVRFVKGYKDMLGGSLTQDQKRLLLIQDKLGPQFYGMNAADTLKTLLRMGKASDARNVSKDLKVS